MSRPSSRPRARSGRTPSPIMEFTDYLRFVVALAFVVGLIGLLAIAAKRFGMAPRIVKDPGRKGRLAIVDMAPLDGRRRLVLVRRDSVEHLVILGATSETVVETSIPAATAAEAGTAEAAPARKANGLRSLTRPRPVDGDLR